MRTTIDIPDELYRQAQSDAARVGIPVDDLITQVLRVALSEIPAVGRQRVNFPLHHSSRPGALTFDAVQSAQDAMAEQEDVARGRAL
jgi:hypothetical protein